MFRRLVAFTIVLFLPATLPSLALAQTYPNCAEAAEKVLQSLPLGSDAVTSIRYERILSPRTQGPSLLGVRAWVKLESCSGFLVIDMTRSCFVRQSYTRGNCEIEGVTRY